MRTYRILALTPATATPGLAACGDIVLSGNHDHSIDREQGSDPGGS